MSITKYDINWVNLLDALSGLGLNLFLHVARMRRKVVHVKPKESDHREFVSGFIRLHILHHAAQEPLVGFWMIEELRRHGYEMSPGTIYPLLHSLEKRGYLSVEVKREGRRAWREYSATKEGRKVLAAAKRKLRELFHELIE